MDEHGTAAVMQNRPLYDDDRGFLKSSIRDKFLVLCVILIVLMAVSISTAYFVLTSRDKETSSRQRIQVAFDMLLHSMLDQIGNNVRGIEEFVQNSDHVGRMAYLYAMQMKRGALPDLLTTFTGASLLFDATTDLKNVAHVLTAERLVLYGTDASILASYQFRDEKEWVGVSAISQAGNQTYLPIEDLSRAMQMFSGAVPIPDLLFPPGIPTHFYGKIPDTTAVNLFNEDRKLGVRITVPIYYLNELVGLLTGDIFYTQAWIDQFASLSKTEIHLFIEDRANLGSLPAQSEPLTDTTQHTASATIQMLLQQRLAEPAVMHVTPLALGTPQYHQGVFTLLNENGTANTITVSVSKDLEHREMRNVLLSVLSIAGVSMTIAFGLSLSFSQRSMTSIQHLVNVMGATASGNLHYTAPVVSRDEFGLLATKLNEMISRLRRISSQTLEVSQAVTTTAETILQEFQTLSQQMQQQSTSVNAATMAVEQIDNFIDRVAGNVSELLTVSAQILDSNHLMSDSTTMVAESTGYLTDHLHEVSGFIDEVSATSQQMTAYATDLLKTVQTTESAVQHIGEALLSVSANTELSKTLAQETVEAALQAHDAVERSREGVLDLKDVIAQSAAIAQTVNTRSAEVSSMLDLVDDVAEQTALLSLNASILSAQAGSHGHGFAVVAQEIRNLSAETKASTKKIADLIKSLQKETAQSVKSITRGLAQADENVGLVNAVQDSLMIISAHARRSSSCAANIATVIQRTAADGRIVQASMETVTAQTADMQTRLQQEDHTLIDVVAAIENIGAMAEQVKKSNIEQHLAAENIETRMTRLRNGLDIIAQQTTHLQDHSDEIVAAMRQIDAITEYIVRHATTMSDQTLNRLIVQAEALQQELSIFQHEA